MKNNPITKNMNYKRIRLNDAEYAFLKNDVRYYYIAVCAKECLCSWSYFYDFIITDNFKENPEHKEIIKDENFRFKDKEMLSNFHTIINTFK